MALSKKFLQLDSALSIFPQANVRDHDNTWDTWDNEEK